MNKFEHRARESTVGRVIAFHVTDQGLIPGTT